MADNVAFELVSPEKILLSDSYEMVVVPGVEGDFAVMAGHAPVVATLRPGVIEIFEGDAPKERIFVNGGFAEVSAERLVVLAEEAVPVSELERATIEQRIQDAREDLADARDDEARRKAQMTIDHLGHFLEAVL